MSDENTVAAESPGMSYPHIAERLFNTPLLMEPGKAEAIAWALRDRLGLEGMAEPSPDFMSAAGPGFEAGERDLRLGYSIAAGVAVVPVHGTLVNRGAWVGASSGLTSYEGLSAQVNALANDDRVRAVMLDIDSRGGEAAGVDDVAEELRILDGIKPVHAMIDGSGSSAAYWIASAARSVSVAQSSNGGSIGVVITHMDVTQAAEQQGVLVTHIHAGAEKVLGSPFRSLSDEDRAKLQARVNETYRLFVEAVAEHRGMSTEDVRATEAGVFSGREMAANGLADRVTTSRRLLAAIQTNFESPDPDSGAGIINGAARANTPEGATDMQTEEQDRAGAAERGAETGHGSGNENMFTEAEAHELAASERQAGVTAERERIAAIMDCEEATGRESLARTLALETSQPAEEAKSILAAAGMDQQNGTGALAAAMQGNSPNVSDDDAASGDEGADEVQAAADQILNA